MPFLQKQTFFIKIILLLYVSDSDCNIIVTFYLKQNLEFRMQIFKVALLSHSERSPVPALGHNFLFFTSL